MDKTPLYHSISRDQSERNVYGANFNNTDDENAPDDRSENKGPEPEAVTVGMIYDKQYALLLVGYEVSGTVAVYQITPI